VDLESIYEILVNVLLNKKIKRLEEDDKLLSYEGFIKYLQTINLGDTTVYKFLLISSSEHKLSNTLIEECLSTIHDNAVVCKNIDQSDIILLKTILLEFLKTIAPANIAVIIFNKDVSDEILKYINDIWKDYFLSSRMPVNLVVIFSHCDNFNNLDNTDNIFTKLENCNEYHISMWNSVLVKLC